MVVAGRELVTTHPMRGLSYIGGQGGNRRCSGIPGKRRVMLISIAGRALQVRMTSFSQFC